MIKCEYCNATKQDNTFVIGASKEPEWCMVEGTGKMSCPKCYVQASNAGQDAIKKHVSNHNDSIKTINERDSNMSDKYNDLTLEELQTTAGIYGITGDSKAELIKKLIESENKSNPVQENEPEIKSDKELQSKYIKELKGNLEAVIGDFDNYKIKNIKLQAENDNLKLEKLTLQKTISEYEKRNTELKKGNQDCTNCLWDIRTIKTRKENLENERDKLLSKGAEIESELLNINTFLN